MIKTFAIIGFIFTVSVIFLQVNAESEKSISELHAEAYQFAKSGEFSNDLTITHPPKKSLFLK